MPNVGVSRSMFTDIIYYDGARSIINPVGQVSVIPVNPNCVPIVYEELKIIAEIDASYGINLANKDYNNLPSSYQSYVDLYTILQNLEITAADNTVYSLLKVAEHLLVGTINSFGLYSENLMLTRDKTILQNKITDILSGKNVSSVNVEPNGGTMVLTQTFTLAAVFNYYILIYGMPDYGVGFDPVRIDFLANVLRGMGIDPYR